MVEITFSGASHAGSLEVASASVRVGGRSTIIDSSGSISTPGNIVLSGTWWHDLLSGDEGDDRLSGLAGNDTLNCGAGNDVMDGGMGNDLLNGGMGNDRLLGAAGADRMAGGADADSFVFLSMRDSTVSAAGRDTITDFSRAQGDNMDFSAIDADVRLSGNQAFRYLGDASFTGHAGELSDRSLGSGTLISGDVNGDRLADFAVLLDDRMTLGANSFIL